VFVFNVHRAKGGTDLHRIDEIVQSSMLPEFVVDFKYTAPFLNAGHSNRTRAENLGQLSDFFTV